MAAHNGRKGCKTKHSINLLAITKTQKSAQITYYSTIFFNFAGELRKKHEGFSEICREILNNKVNKAIPVKQ